MVEFCQIEQYVGMRKPYKKPDRSSPGHFIAAWREYRDMTQERLASRVDMSIPQVSKIENGKQGYRQDTLQAFAEALSCEPADLLRPPPASWEDELRAYIAKMDSDRAARALRILKTAFDQAA